MHQTTSEYIGLHQTASDYIRLHQTTSEYIRLQKNTLEYLGIYQITKKYFGIPWNTSDYKRIRWNILKCSAGTYAVGDLWKYFTVGTWPYQTDRQSQGQACYAGARTLDGDGLCLISESRRRKYFKVSPSDTWYIKSERYHNSKTVGRIFPVNSLVFLGNNIASERGTWGAPQKNEFAQANSMLVKTKKVLGYS